MPYIGKSPISGGFHKLGNLTASATATYALTLNGAAYYPETANQLLVSLNGVIQAPQDSFTVSGSNLVFDSALTASDSIDFVVALGDVLGVQGVTDGAVSTAKIANQAVTMDKLATSGTLPALDGSALTGISAGSNILEQLFLNGNGDSVTVSSGTYSLSNITVKQALTESYADITGSSISYTPPSGATLVVYEFNFRVYGAYPSVITHFKMYMDSDEVTQARKTYGGGGSYDGEHVNHRWAIAIGGSADTASGRVASWTSAKTIKLMGRNYTTVSYGANVHENVYWDGSALAQVVVPTMQITAYK